MLVSIDQFFKHRSGMLFKPKTVQKKIKHVHALTEKQAILKK